MELLYIKFLDDTILGNLELNFSHDLRFSITDNKLSVEMVSYKSIFKNPIANLSLIIGKNGVGKSTILRRIGEELHNEGGKDLIQIFRGEEVIRVCVGSYKLEISKELRKKFKIEFETLTARDADICNGDISAAYFTETMDNSITMNSHNYMGSVFLNYTPSYIFNNLSEYINRKEDKLQIPASVKNYKSFIRAKQIMFFNDNIIKGYKKPDHIRVSFMGEFLDNAFTYSEKIILDYLKSKNIDKNEMWNNKELMSLVDPYINQHLNVLTILGNGEMSAIDKIMKIHLFYIIDTLIRVQNKYVFINYDDINQNNGTKSETTELQELESLRIYRVLLNSIGTDEIYYLIKDVMINLNCVNYLYHNTDEEKDQIYLIDLIRECLEKYDRLLFNARKYYDPKTGHIDLPLTEGFDFVVDYITLRNLINQNIILPSNFSYLLNGSEFYFSSGQERLINLFVNLNDAIEKVRELSNNEDKSLLLLFDEPEISMHPEMQLELISKLTEFLSRYNDIKIQVFLTSHSPILASDLTSNHVQFLYKVDEDVYSMNDNEKPKTFAQNIYSLYKDSFFVEDAVIGKYADKVIMQLASELSNKDDSYERVLPSGTDINFVIDEIGEPVIKKYINGLRVREKRVQNILKEQGISDNLIQQVLEELKTQSGYNL